MCNNDFTNLIAGISVIKGVTCDLFLLREKECKVQFINYICSHTQNCGEFKICKKIYEIGENLIEKEIMAKDQTVQIVIFQTIKFITMWFVYGHHLRTSRRNACI